MYILDKVMAAVVGFLHDPLPHLVIYIFYYHLREGSVTRYRGYLACDIIADVFFLCRILGILYR
ncbi:MAG: hypothetical protein BGP14_10055 [Sphingobacteriales bacterium 44-15]|nr:MAG: hypothetical protein BGP14_10055 [Sphingobacteriales bacterium 44-15]